MNRFVTLVVAAFLLSSCINNVGDRNSNQIKTNSTEDTKDSGESWHCYDYVYYRNGKVLIRLARIQEFGLDTGTGKVLVAGETYYTHFRLQGIDRRWNFGTDYKYSFIIEPDGTGKYFDFSGLKFGEKTRPRQLYKCEKKR
ncbi:MAG: hypothetical protein OXH64_13330 [Rhodospirillaceae bacterium]|nr:hypothetical protein [Rhodospirillaceae bacterium]